MSETEVLAFIAQTAITYIFIQVATGNAQKQTITDQKTDLRTTKDDIMSEIKSTREELLRESEISTKAIIDILKAEIQKELEAVKSQNNKEQK